RAILASEAWQAREGDLLAEGLGAPFPAEGWNSLTSQDVRRQPGPWHWVQRLRESAVWDLGLGWPRQPPLQGSALPCSTQLLLHLGVCWYCRELRPDPALHSLWSQEAGVPSTGGTCLPWPQNAPWHMTSLCPSGAWWCWRGSASISYSGAAFAQTVRLYDQQHISFGWSMALASLSCITEVLATSLLLLTAHVLSLQQATWAKGGGSRGMPLCHLQLLCA
uniref:Uncharacterized protein n=1 Tax=Pelusios castaneus TaxID=367368 RepID=A0A8C8S6V3_9SAUR